MISVTSVFDPGDADWVEDGLLLDCVSPLVCNAHTYKEQRRKAEAAGDEQNSEAPVIRYALCSYDKPFRLCVTDGVSGVYTDEKPIYLTKEGFSGGEMATLLVQQAFGDHPIDQPLKPIFDDANQRILRWHQEQGINLERLQDRAGACAAAIRYDPITRKVHTAYIGDSLIFWKCRDRDDIFMSSNQVDYVSRLGLDMKQQCLEEFPRDLQRAKVEWYKRHICRMRYDYMNQVGMRGAYGILSGQPEAMGFVTEATFDVEDLEFAAAVTDGAVPGIFDLPPSVQARWLYNVVHRRTDINYFLETIRGVYQSYAEVSGVFLDFCQPHK